MNTDAFKAIRKQVSDSIPVGWWGAAIGVVIFVAILLTPLAIFSTLLWWLWGGLGLNESVVELGWWHCVGIIMLVTFLTNLIKGNIR